MGTEGLVHVFVAGDPDARPFIMFHGSHGHETDLMPLAHDLGPEAPKIGLRGAVAMTEGHAFFRRLPDRSIDEVDLVGRIPELATCIDHIRAAHSLDRRPVAIGFSNGAIMAMALAITLPHLFEALVLFRPLTPLECDRWEGLDDLPVLLLDGLDDERRTPGDGRRLAQRLREVGALVAHHELPVGHAITSYDRRIARRWLTAVMASRG